MKTLCIAILAFSIAFSSVSAQEMDKELASLAEKLAVPVKEHGTKKITVLDFADLHGTESELGKYIAEQLTVDFVLTKRDFAVLDRANLAKILAEHKLTAKGLVDPENAKKLGQFAGVDALVLGTIIPKGQNVSLTAKIITTDTAEVVGAARADFKSDETVKELLARVAFRPKDDESGEAAKTESLGPSKSFGDLSIIFERLTKMQDGSVVISFIFRNKSKNKSIAVAMHGEPNYGHPIPLRSSLTGVDGTQCKSDEREMTGIHLLVAEPGALTQIKPGGEIKPTLKFWLFHPWSEYLTSLRLQAEVVINDDYRANQYADFRIVPDLLPPHCEVENMVLDIPIAKGK